MTKVKAKAKAKVEAPPPTALQEAVGATVEEHFSAGFRAIFDAKTDLSSAIRDHAGDFMDAGDADALSDRILASVTEALGDIQTRWEYVLDDVRAGLSNSIDNYEEDTLPVDADSARRFLTQLLEDAPTKYPNGYEWDVYLTAQQLLGV